MDYRTVRAEARLTSRFESRIDKAGAGECWIWTGSFRPNGYGRFTFKRSDLSAHRFAYELYVGPIGEGLQIDHLCRNKACVNPAHLEPVTAQVNQFRIPNSKGSRQACPAGHPYDEVNTYRPPSGGRTCRICRRAATYRWKQRHAD